MTAMIGVDALEGAIGMSEAIDLLEREYAVSRTMLTELGFAKQ